MILNELVLATTSLIILSYSELLSLWGPSDLCFELSSARSFLHLLLADEGQPINRLELWSNAEDVSRTGKQIVAELECAELRARETTDELLLTGDANDEVASHGCL